MATEFRLVTSDAYDSAGDRPSPAPLGVGGKVLLGPSFLIDSEEVNQDLNDE
jgi:hypothetical protein